jgi:Mce-associated membrane protein
MTGVRRGVGVVVVAVMAALAVLLAALSAFAAARASHRHALDEARRQVAAAAASAVPVVLSYDYRHLPRDFARAEAQLTPNFRKQYIRTTAKGVQPLAAKYKAISSADVTASGVVDNGVDRAVVLVFVSQTVTNSLLSAPRLDRSRINVTLVRSGGRWLIDKLAPV